MANIKVHLLNFHGIFSHTELLLEDTSVEPHLSYVINRWCSPRSKWRPFRQQELHQASSIYSFDIEADPQKIIDEWTKYWIETNAQASILGNNCAVAAQWFLTRFAHIPAPNLSNVSVNYIIGPLFWPSFIPCPVTLPGRIISNAKFYMEARNHPEIANQYSRLFLYTSIALTALAVTASIVALTIAAIFLSGLIAALVIIGCVAAGAASSYGFFKTTNTLSAKNIADNNEPPPPPIEGTDVQREDSIMDDRNIPPFVPSTI